MKTEAVLRDPVFQLNLLIWMAKEQPANGYRVRPFFFENGFRLVYIEQPFAFPDATARAIESSTLAITKAPEPETILGRAADQKALFFEAKANSFSPESSNSGQARGHLLACGPAFAETLNPLKQALLCYVVPQDRCDLMRNCLDLLATELRSATLAPGVHSIHGLGVSGQDLIYSWDEEFKQHSGVTEDSVPVLHELRDDTDPSPLLLVFTDEDCPNTERSGFYRRVLINQVVAKLVCDLNLLLPEKTYVTTARELLRQTTDGILEFVGRERQSSMIRIVRQIIIARISSFWRDKNFSPVKVETDRLEITFKDTLAKSEFLDWLEDSKRNSFSDERPPIEQPVLPGLELAEEDSQ
jgi:hypothetical protein